MKISYLAMDLSTLKNLLNAGDWTLFLDRDGVINRRKMNGYIMHPGEFHLLDGVEDAIHKFRETVTRIIVVTNQRGIARGLMSEEDLQLVHDKMVTLLEKNETSVDAIFYCPHDRDTGCLCRKPGPGMPLQALAQFPEIDFTRSVMVGDTASDMQMGRSLGMVCIHIGPEFVDPDLYDLHLEKLADFWTSEKN